MKCNDCLSTNVRVTSTDHKDSQKTWRYYKCLDCDARYKTEERYAPRLTSGPKPGSTRGPRRNQVVGEQVGSAVLTESNVKHLRQLAEAGYTYPALAKRFGINPGTVYRIVKRKTWKHI